MDDLDRIDVFEEESLLYSPRAVQNDGQLDSILNPETENSSLQGIRKSLRKKKVADPSPTTDRGRGQRSYKNVGNKLSHVSANETEAFLNASSDVSYTPQQLNTAVAEAEAKATKQMYEQMTKTLLTMMQQYLPTSPVSAPTPENILRLNISNTLPRGTRLQAATGFTSTTRADVHINPDGTIPMPQTVPPNTSTNVHSSQNNIENTNVSGMLSYYNCSKPMATVVLTKDIKYDTWRNYLRLALRTAGLLYLIDPSIPAPFSHDHPTTSIHKAKFCEIVGNRLLPPDQNRVAHFTEPVDVIRRLDE